MPKAEWGTKHICRECGAKFYDMLRTPPACPACRSIVGVETNTAIGLVEGDDESRDEVLVDVAAVAALKTENDDGEDQAPFGG